VAGKFAVSRNTVREAFRILTNERLLAYEAHRGVAVRNLTSSDVREIYELRRLLELHAVELFAGRQDLLPPLAATLQAAEQAAGRDDWREVGTENLNFHCRLMDANDGDRVREFFGRLMTEMRLGFLALADPHQFHEPYLARNREIYTCLSAGKVPEAKELLEEYLTGAEGKVEAATEALDTASDG
jgi:DNA-binding GntR family transcriptional regulator